ncbi:hypothetical protein KPSA3_03441 [Pseudomonas syringae pv. actinidiae]|nr:hypothetical protein KPSA3_03441 [Pseudomonas syringae pv. actinidiae]
MLLSFCAALVAVTARLMSPRFSLLSATKIPAKARKPSRGNIRISSNLILKGAFLSITDLGSRRLSIKTICDLTFCINRRFL